jgi:hypothetical protein
MILIHPQPVQQVAADADIDLKNTEKEEHTEVVHLAP